MHGGVSSWERILGVLIDVALAAVTAGLGLILWTTFLFRNRQTPSGRLRDKVIVDSRTARLVSPGKYVAREAVTIGMFVYLVSGFFWGFGVVIDVGGFWINSFVIPIFFSFLIAVDVLWVFLPPKRRLIDVILRINVVEGQGISYLESVETRTGLL